MEMMSSFALGQASAHASIKPLTIPALMLNKSSRVMPGLRGTPAGMTTTSAPLSASKSWSPAQTFASQGSNKAFLFQFSFRSRYCRTPGRKTEKLFAKQPENV